MLTLGESELESSSRAPPMGNCREHGPLERRRGAIRTGITVRQWIERVAVARRHVFESMPVVRSTTDIR
jgi:hypothetical protein